MTRSRVFSTIALCGALCLSGCSGKKSGDDGPSSPRDDGGPTGDGGQVTNPPGSGPTDDGGGAQGDGGTGPGPGPDEPPPPPPTIPGIMALRIEPASVTLTDDGVDPGETADFEAIGTFANGERDVTAEVAWLLDEPELGEIDEGAFTSAGVGGQTLVRARAQGAEAEAELTVTLEVAVPATGAPDGITELFEPDPMDDVVVDDDGLRIVYPSHETMFPRNLERVDFQWRADAAFDRFELRFESAVAHVILYTADRHLLSDAQTWRWLATTHAGRSLEMSVRATSSTAPDMITRSQPITLYFSRSEVLGALYYWSTGSEGVMKGTISAAMATKFYTDPAGDDTTCVACHTVSRNGQRLSAGYDGEKLRVISVPDRELITPSDPAVAGDAYGWGTFDPAANQLLYASRGMLSLLDLSDPMAMAAPVDLGGMLGTHPDWAPNGEHVALAVGSDGIGNKDAQGTSIARMPVNADGSFGAVELLLPSTDGDQDTLFFPSHSPDSRWLAFVRAVGKSKDNETSVLALLPADGGDPIPLVRLNQRVRHEDGVLDIGNTMPTWAPSTKPDIFWLAFSSLRAYGDVLPAGGRDQLWAVAIDPTLIGTGEDPSFAAFWLPFQDPEAGNHRAFWAIDTEQTCPSDTEVCDGVDNDCDGLVDEDCTDNMCREYGQSCEQAAECCDGVPCTAGICRVPLG